MSVCPVCQKEFPAMPSGHLCPTCASEVLAKDTYSAGDLRFVGVLAGALSAAIFSMPGAMAGHLIGRMFNNATRGCTIGVVVFALIGMLIGLIAGPAMIRKMEAAKRQA